MKPVSSCERGFTLIEVVASMLVLAMVGAAATFMVLRLNIPREFMIQYEQRSLAARAAAEEIWALFSDVDKGPVECPLEEIWPPEGPSERAEYVNLGGDDENGYSYTFRCRPFENIMSDDPNRLFEVQVWLKRNKDDKIVDEFGMYARLGGISGSAPI